MRKEIQMLSSQSLSILISVISLRKRNPYNTRIQCDIAFYWDRETINYQLEFYHPSAYF